MYEVVLYLSNDMYLPGMPSIAYELALTEHEIQTTLTLWFLGASALQFILGPISDRYGRRKVILGGAIIFIIASIFCATATSLTTMLLARLVQGTTICTLVAGYAAVQETFSTKQAIKLFAIINAITILAPALGPLFGAIFIQVANWRYIFWFLAGANLLILVALFFFLPETNKTFHKLKVSTIVKEYINILCNKNFLIACGSYFLLVAVEFLWAFESPFIMMEIYHTSILFYGIAQTVIFGCFLMGALATKLLLEHYNIKILMQTGILITITGTILFWFISMFYPTIIAGIACMMLIALGSSILVAPLTRLALASCTQPIGMVTAVFTSTTNLAGVAVGVLLLLNKTDSLFYVATITMICVAIAILLILRLRIQITKKGKFKKLF